MYINFVDFSSAYCGTNQVGGGWARQGEGRGGGTGAREERGEGRGGKGGWVGGRPDKGGGGEEKEREEGSTCPPLWARRAPHSGPVGPFTLGQSGPSSLGPSGPPSIKPVGLPRVLKKFKIQPDPAR